MRDYPNPLLGGLGVVGRQVFLNKESVIVVALNLDLVVSCIAGSVAALHLYNLVVALGVLVEDVLVLDLDDSLLDYLSWLRNAGVVALCYSAVSLGGLVAGSVVELLDHRILMFVTS